MSEIKVLDKGSIRLINHMGGDTAIVAAARVSNGASYEGASKGEEADGRLIRFLMKHRHGSPFEHVVFTFFVKAPIFVVREWQRHRIASYNEQSGRYTEFEPEFYIPETWRIPSLHNKQDSFPYTSPDGLWEAYLTDDMAAQTDAAFRSYKLMLNNGVAREMARMVLPVNLYTSFYFTVNARSLMNFMSLRCAEGAQWEIQEYAKAIREVFREILPLTYEAWEGQSYIAP